MLNKFKKKHWNSVQFEFGLFNNTIGQIKMKRKGLSLNSTFPHNISKSV